MAVQVNSGNLIMMSDKMPTLKDGSRKEASQLHSRYFYKNFALVTSRNTSLGVWEHRLFLIPNGGQLLDETS